jgi:hypothetical protein
MILIEDFKIVINLPYSYEKYIIFPQLHPCVVSLADK